MKRESEKKRCRQQYKLVSGHLLMQGRCPCANVTLNCTGAPPLDPQAHRSPSLCHFIQPGCTIENRVHHESSQPTV